MTLFWVSIATMLFILLFFAVWPFTDERATKSSSWIFINRLCFSVTLPLIIFAFVAFPEFDTAQNARQAFITNMYKKVMDELGKPMPPSLDLFTDMDKVTQFVDQDIVKVIREKNETIKTQNGEIGRQKLEIERQRLDIVEKADTLAKALESGQHLKGELNRAREGLEKAVLKHEDEMKKVNAISKDLETKLAETEKLKKMFMERVKQAKKEGKQLSETILSLRDQLRTSEKEADRWKKSAGVRGDSEAAKKSAEQYIGQLETIANTPGILANYKKLGAFCNSLGSWFYSYGSLSDSTELLRRYESLYNSCPKEKE